MRGILRTWPLLAGLVVVYLAPLSFGWALQVTAPSQSAEARAAAVRAIAGFSVAVINPLACMVLGFFAGWRRGAVWLFPILAAVCFVPFTLGVTAIAGPLWPVVYLAFCAIGWFFGWQVHRRQLQAASDQR